VGIPASKRPTYLRVGPGSHHWARSFRSGMMWRGDTGWFALQQRTGPPAFRSSFWMDRSRDGEQKLRKWRPPASFRRHRITPVGSAWYLLWAHARTREMQVGKLLRSVIAPHKPPCSCYCDLHHSCARGARYVRVWIDPRSFDDDYLTYHCCSVHYRFFPRSHSLVPQIVGYPASDIRRVVLNIALLVTRGSCWQGPLMDQSGISLMHNQ